MDCQAQGVIQFWQTGKQNGRPVSGIHFKVKQDFQVVQNGIVDVVGFVNDNDRGLPLFQGKTGDFFLDRPEIVITEGTG